MPGGLRGREGLLRAIEDEIGRGRQVLLTGPRGSGRTALLRLVSERSESPVLLATGMAQLADHLGIAATGLDAYTRIPKELRATGTMLLVDDADQLDRRSAVLLGQLSRAGVALVMACVRLGHLADPLHEEVRRPTWRHLALPPLDDDDLLALAADLLGDELSAPAAAYLLTRSRGVPGIATELISGAGPALHTPWGTELGTPEPTDRLIELRGAALQALDPVESEWLIRLCVAGRLPTRLLPRHVLAHLSAVDAVTDSDGVVTASDELLSDVVSAQLTPQMWRTVCASTATQLTSMENAESTTWTALAALLRVRAGESLSAAEAVAAASHEVGHQRYAEASDLLAAADPATLDARHEAELMLLRGVVSSATGEHEAAHRLLLALSRDPATPSPLLPRIGRELGLLHAVRRRDPLTAIREVQEVVDCVSSEQRGALEADLVKWHLMAGLPAPALPGAREAAALEERIGIVLIEAMISSLDGSPARTRELVADGFAMLAAAESPSPHHGSLLQLSHYLSLAFEGRLGDAEEWAVSRRDSAARAADPSLGMWEYAAAELGLHAGRLSWAQGLAQRAARHLAWQDFTGLFTTATALQAAVEARTGDLDRAVMRLDALGGDAESDVKVALHAARVRAERHRLAGAPELAAAELLHVARRARAEAHGHLATLAFDEAWMLWPNAVSDLQEGEAGAAGTLAELLRDRRRAWECEEPASLIAVADTLAERGFGSRALHCWVEIGRRADALGNERLSARARRSRAAILTATSCSRWPSGGDLSSLTARESEIATLAAARVRSREIGTRLGLSVRTVDNHMARILRKLGMSRRSELEQLDWHTDRRDRDV
ncbi:helix-turn-helix transcriptional regulator [Nocardioides daejeonensis]|uniref:helix-turn-helix transcriptional regulator n=1 Tax=Nocardioides daejeonensis TaxID=1046556 RepID=UPI000D745A6E|nr:LuxR C-terminal-related transcriptional regulator [Nocardioides daejeonensis]